MGKAGALIEALRWRRRRQMRLARAWRKRRELAALADRTDAIRKGDVLAFLVLRNEAQRLPHLLAHYRALGVAHFLVVDNDSTDASRDLLVDQADGIYVWDGQGKRYIDGPAGMWCVQIGYGRDEMAEAIYDQVKRLPYTSPFTNATEPAAVLARKLPNWRRALTRSRMRH